MNDPLDTSYQSPWLDAVALVRAIQNHDTDSVTQVLDGSDGHRLAVVLAQMCATAVRSDATSLDEYLDDEITRTLDAARDDAELMGYDDQEDPA